MMTACTLGNLRFHKVVLQFRIIIEAIDSTMVYWQCFVKVGNEKGMREKRNFLNTRKSKKAAKWLALTGTCLLHQQSKLVQMSRFW